jgi:hypothetical protein
MVEPIIDALHDEVVQLGAELVIVDGTERGDAVDRGAGDLPSRDVRVSCHPGADVFQLRAYGLAEARGDIVAVTEDHSVPTVGYLSSILDAHRRHAEAVVAGAVVNGSSERWIDRVNFLLVHARNLPAQSSLPGSGWVPTPTNESFKRSAVPERVPDRGWLETVHNVVLLQAGQVVFDDKIVVRHVQSLGTVGTIRNHFHAGRSMGGLARDAVGDRRTQLRWGARSAVALPRNLARPAWEVAQRDRAHQREILPLLPAVVALSLVDVIGFVCGVVAGPGASADLVE